MKSILVLGCSNTFGFELANNYFCLKVNNKNEFSIERYNDWLDIVEKLKISKKEYFDKCKELAWPNILKNNLNKVALTNYSFGGGTLTFYKSIFFGPKNEYLENKFKDFKEKILNNDILIWQIVQNDTFYTEFKDFKYSKLFFVNYEDFLRKLNNNDNINKEDKDYLKKYFRIINFKVIKYSYDFLNYILIKRAKEKKYTFIFSFFKPDTELNYYHTIKSKYIIYLDKYPNSTLIDKFIKEKKIRKDEIIESFGHVSKKVHDLTADELLKKIKIINSKDKK